MARKSSSNATSTEAGSTTGSASTSAKSSVNKTQAVQEVLKLHITSPVKIADYLKKEYGLDITAAHVSTIKGNLKRRKGTGKRGRPKGSTKKAIAEAAATAAAALVATTAAKAAPAPKAGGLTPSDLRTLSDMAHKAGGFGQLREYLEVLGGR
jgi:hypothetical protein